MTACQSLLGKGVIVNSDDIKLITIENLKLSDLPSGRITWHNFSFFALTFDPRSENLNEQELACIGEKIPSPRHNLKVLRAFLYNWQRIWNNTTEEAPASFYSDVGAF